MCFLFTEQTVSDVGFCIHGYLWKDAYVWIHMGTHEGPVVGWSPNSWVLGVERGGECIINDTLVYAVEALDPSSDTMLPPNYYGSTQLLGRQPTNRASHMRVSPNFYGSAQP